MESIKSLKSLGYILTVIIAAVVAMTALTYGSSAATSGDFEYEILEVGTAEIIDYTGSALNLLSPQN